MNRQSSNWRTIRFLAGYRRPHLVDDATCGPSSSGRDRWRHTCRSGETDRRPCTPGPRDDPASDVDPGTHRRHDPAADDSNTATEANRVTAYGVRIGVGTRCSYDGEVVEIIEVLTTPAGNEVVLTRRS